MGLLRSLLDQSQRLGIILTYAQLFTAQLQSNEMLRCTQHD